MATVWPAESEPNILDCSVVTNLIETSPPFEKETKVKNCLKNYLIPTGKKRYRLSFWDIRAWLLTLFISIYTSRTKALTSSLVGKHITFLLFTSRDLNRCRRKQLQSKTDHFFPQQMAYIHHQQYWIVRNLNHLRLFPSSHGDIFNVERIGTEKSPKLCKLCMTYLCRHLFWRPF